MRSSHLVVFVLGTACSDRSVSDGPLGASSADAASSLDGGTGDGAIDGAVPPVGCAGPPEEGFDPASTYVAPTLVPTVIVTSTDDRGPGSLREAVAKGGVVGFAGALAGKTIALLSTIEIGGSVTIDGSAARGLTIDLAQNGGAFHFNGDSATKLRFFSLRIVNGKTTQSGGAISINGGAIDLEIGGVVFESNTAGEGGAIRVGYRSPKVFVHDSTFRRNDGSIANSGFSGGAISVSGGNLHVARCRFDSNVGSTTGAVYAIHANPVIEDSVFVGNKSSGASGSGAFFADGGGPGDYNNGDKTPGEITLRRSLFLRNRGAGDDGGAGELYAYPADTVTVEGCTFHDNESNPGRAGALFIHADQAVNVLRTAFVGNHATSPGGAIWADGSAVYTFENDLFSENVTDSDLGGALRLNVADTAKLRIVSSTFADNRAQNGNGALWLAGMRDVRVKNSIFANNTAMGGAQQINFPVVSDGGNIEWPDPKTASTLPMAKVVDPLLLPVVLDQGAWVRPIAAGSPAVGAAVKPGPAVDQRGAVRDAMPDIGSYELGATCTP